MMCSRCDGNMVEKRVNFCVCNVSPPILIENVPAHVCTRCGGEVFSDATIAAFERVRDGRVPYRMGVVRVFDFADAGIPPQRYYIGVEWEHWVHVGGYLLNDTGTAEPVIAATSAPVEVQ